MFSFIVRCFRWPFFVAWVALVPMMTELTCIGAEVKAENRTAVEHEQKRGAWVKTSTLGTKKYAPSKKESEFFDRLASDENVTGGIFGDYSITGKVGKYIGWYGIVRRIKESKEKGTTELLVEMKYFDGLTDLHIMAVSFNGAGDFEAILLGTGHDIKPLSFVKVYGQVEKEVESVPYVSACYVREWDWGTFTFLMAYGEQKGNTAWQKLNKVPLDDIYDAWPNGAYYEKRLGERPKAPPPEPSK